MPDAATSAQQAFNRIVAEITTGTTASFGLDDVRRGVPVGAFDETAAMFGLTPPAFARALGMSERTLKRRRDSGEKRLTAAESDRLLHAREVLAMAVEAFDGRAAEAARWLTTPKAALGGQTPAEQLDTRLGTRSVEQMLIAMTYLMPV